MKPTLIYFDIKARAEPIRLAFEIGGIEFEDKRISKEDFKELKPKLPFGQLPVLEVDGKYLSQSNAILEWAARKGGLAPTDPMEAARVQEVLGAFEDIKMKLVPSLFEPDAAKKSEVRSKLANEILPPMFSGIEKVVARNGHDGFCVGNRITTADLVLNGIVDWMSSGILDGIPTTVLDPYPNIKQVAAAVQAHPKVAAWNAKHAKPTI